MNCHDFDFDSNQKENVYFHKNLYQCCVEHIQYHHHEEKMGLYEKFEHDRH